MLGLADYGSDDSSDGSDDEGEYYAVEVEQVDEGVVLGDDPDDIERRERAEVRTYPDATAATTDAPSTAAYPNTDAQFACARTDPQSTAASPHTDAPFAAQSTAAYPDTDAQFAAANTDAQWTAAYPNTDAQFFETQTTMWKEHRDPESMCTYFHNDKTGESTWDEPTEGYDPADPIPEPPQGWIATLDAGSGLYYYFHVATQVSTWNFPSAAQPPVVQKDVYADLAPDIADRLRMLRGDQGPSPSKQQQQQPPRGRLPNGQQPPRGRPPNGQQPPRGPPPNTGKRRRPMGPQVDLMDVSAPGYATNFTVPPHAQQQRGGPPRGGGQDNVGLPSPGEVLRMNAAAAAEGRHHPGPPPPGDYGRRR